MKVTVIKYYHYYYNRIFLVSERRLLASKSDGLVCLWVGIYLYIPIANLAYDNAISDEYSYSLTLKHKYEFKTDRLESFWKNSFCNIKRCN